MTPKGKFISWFYRPKNLWFFIFCYTILIGLLVQFIVLPYFFPSLHAGDGLLIGLDGTKFHRIALELVEKIETSGWSEWTLVPSNQMVSGIAAIFYVLIYPAPWTVLPLNAVLNATAGICIYLILYKISEDHSVSFAAVIPFLFFPSNLLWNAQFHNENYAVPGVAMILYGWVVILNQRTESSKPGHKEIIVGYLAILIGNLLVGLVRPEIQTGLTLLFCLVGFVLLIVGIAQKSTRLRNSVPIVIAGISMLSGLMLTQGISSIWARTTAYISTETTAFSERQDPEKRWEETTWLPELVDDQFKTVANLRKTHLRAWDHAGSNIDSDIYFNDTGDVIRYIPRAAQIAFFSPFPNLWFSEGKKVTGTTMRLVSTFEMMIVYLLLAGLPIFLWHTRKKEAVWAVFLVCTSMLIIYAMTIPNLGALYRFRYPYLMPLVCFGLMGWLWTFRSRWKITKKAAH